MTQGMCDVSANEYPTRILLRCLSWEGEGKPTGIIIPLSGPFERVNTKRARMLSEQNKKKKSTSPMNM